LLAALRPLLTLAPRCRVPDELVLRKPAPAHAIAIDLGSHGDEALHDLHLAHLHRDHRAGLVLDDRSVLHDVQRETRLPEPGSAGDEDEVGRLQASGLLVERLETRLDPDAQIASRIDLFRIATQRDIERDDVAMERRLAER